MVRTGWRWSGEEHAVTDHRQRRGLQNVVVRTLLIAGFGCGLAQPLAADRAEPAIVRVRSSDPVLSALIERAAGHSATFQRLLTTIQGSNGIVYVEVGECPHILPACLKTWMKTVGPNRFLRVYVDTRKIQSDVDSMAAIGHELQHAVEALSETGVTDTFGLFNFFDRHASRDSGWFETPEAIHAGDDIQKELRASERKR